MIHLKLETTLVFNPDTKIIKKVLSKRIKNVLPLLISSNKQRML